MLRSRRQKGELLFTVNNFLRTARLNNVIESKDERVQKILKQLFQSEKNLDNLNEEIIEDKRRLQESLNDMVSLNELLDSKSGKILEMNEGLAARFDSTVSLLVNIIELKQSSHRGHSERVADISVFIAKRMVTTNIPAIPAIPSTTAPRHHRSRHHRSRPPAHTYTHPSILSLYFSLSLSLSTDASHPPPPRGVVLDLCFCF